MTYRLSQFEGLAGLRVVRDGPFQVTGKLSTPLDDLCVPLRSSRYLDAINANPQIVAVITTPELADGLDVRFAVAVAERPDDAHAEIHAVCARQAEDVLRARVNRIHPDARIDSLASIAGYGVEIGPNVAVGPFVRIEAGVTVEEGCRLHSGVVLGVQGFNTGIIDGRQRIFPQLGGVRLKPHVELLANVCVARALFGGETTIGEETVVDNLSYIAHDVQIGRRVLICALANILGRAWIGDGAYIGPSAVIVNGARVEAGGKVSIGAVVTRDVPAGETVTGNFALPHTAFLNHLRQIRGS